MTDGAGAVLLMKRSVAMRKGLPILGVFRYINPHTHRFNASMYVWMDGWMEMLLVSLT